MRNVGTFYYRENEYTLKSARYQNNGRIALQAWDEAGCFATISINISEANLKPDEFVLNHDAPHDLMDAIINTFPGIDDTGRTVTYGVRQNQPVYYFVR